MAWVRAGGVAGLLVLFAAGSAAGADEAMLTSPIQVNGPPPREAVWWLCIPPVDAYCWLGEEGVEHLLGLLHLYLCDLGWCPPPMCNPLTLDEGCDLPDEPPQPVPLPVPGLQEPLDQACAQHLPSCHVDCGPPWPDEPKIGDRRIECTYDGTLPGV